MLVLEVPRGAIRAPDIARIVRRPSGQISLFVAVSATCEQCGSPFTEPVPLVIDELEQPELWARARAGAVARFPCPNAHTRPDDNVSYLLRDRRGRLTFVAGDAVPQERWADECAPLLGALPGALVVGDPVVLPATGRAGLAPEPQDGEPAAGGPADVPDDARRAFGKSAMRAQAQMDRYRATGRSDALDAAIGAWNAVLTHPVFDSAPAATRAAVLQAAGAARLTRSQVPPATRRNLTAEADLDAAIRDLRNGHALLGDSRSRSNLVLALEARWERRHRGADLDELIGVLRAERHHGGHRARSDLAHRLWDRFGRERRTTDLDEAVTVLRAQDDGDSATEVMLGMCLLERHGVLNEPGDLEAALAHIEAAATKATSAAELNAVGNARTQADSAGAVDALDGAIDAYERAVQRAEGDRHRPGYFGNLANAYRHRFRRAHDPGDLDAAVDAYAAALELETMIEVYEQEVVGSTASPLIAPALANLARSLLERDGPGDHARADALLDRIAASLEATDPESALFAARAWAEADAGHGRWDRAAEAYQLAQDAADELFRVQIGRRHREARLTPSGSLGARAALACVRAARPRMAALALERSRARLLSDALERDRLDLDALRGLGRQDLVERYQDATAALPW